MRANYHTHTRRCQHASGTEEEFVRLAIEHGYDVLGFSDHCPWPYGDGFVSGIRMTACEFPGYVRTVRALGERYAREIKVLCGLECEYFPDYIEWMRDLSGEAGLDYLILGNHFDGVEKGGFYFGACREPGQMRRYLEWTVEGMQTGMFAYLAHPDLFLRAMPAFDDDCRAVSRELCRAAKALRVPLEYNLLGLRYGAKARQGLGYPCERFWEVAAEEGCQAIVGLDAHHASHLCDPELFDLARLYVGRMGVECLDSLQPRA